MAAFVRACAYRFTSRHQLASFSVVRNAKCMLQDLCLPRSLSRPCSHLTHAESDQSHNVRLKVLTDENLDLHKRISALFVGRGGHNIRRLNTECGLEFSIKVVDDCILVSGPDAEGVESTAETVSQEVQRIRDLVNPPFTEKVLTDEDSVVHNTICRMIIGKGGQNIERIRSDPDIGRNFQLQALQHADHVLISGSDAEVVRRAAEKVQQEIQRVHDQNVSENVSHVSTDEDETVHDRVCGMLIGRGGENIKRFVSESGLDFQLDIPKHPQARHVVICGTDAEITKRATEKITQEVERIRNDIGLLSSEKVLTDDTEEVHDQICRMIIGKGGENIKNIMAETGLDFHLNVPKFRLTGHVLVTGNDAEMVKKAAERVSQDIQRIRFVSEKVSTDEDGEVHNMICSMLIGKGGENIKRFIFETGLNFKLDTLKNKTASYVLVTGADEEVVKKAAEKIRQEVERLRNRIVVE